MGKGLLIVGALAGMLSACGGDVGTIPEDYVTYGFTASVAIATPDPTPGRQVSFTVAVTSVGNTPVHCDVILHVVSDGSGGDIYDQRWDNVLFQPQAQWDLTNGFLPATDVKSTYHLEVEVRRHDTGELLEDNKQAGTLTFPST
jgi:hypothetical protein